MHIIAQLLKPLFLWHGWRGCCESNPALRRCLSLCAHHLAGSCSYAFSARGGWVSQTCPARFTGGKRGWSGWEVEGYSRCDLRSEQTEPQHQSPSLSSPEQTPLVFGTTAACPVWMFAHTINHIGYPPTFLSPLQKIYITCRDKTISSKNHSYFTLYKLFYNHFNKLHVKLQ